MKYCYLLLILLCNVSSAAAQNADSVPEPYKIVRRPDPEMARRFLDSVALKRDSIRSVRLERFYLRSAVGLSYMHTFANIYKPGITNVGAQPLLTAAFGCDLDYNQDWGLIRLELGYTLVSFSSGKGSGYESFENNKLVTYEKRYRSNMGYFGAMFMLLAEVPIAARREIWLYFGGGGGINLSTHYKARWVYRYPDRQPEKVTDLYFNSSYAVPLLIGLSLSHRLRAEVLYINDIVDDQEQAFDRHSFVLSCGYVLNKGYKRFGAAKRTPAKYR